MRMWMWMRMWMKRNKSTYKTLFLHLKLDFVALKARNARFCYLRYMLRKLIALLPRLKGKNKFWKSFFIFYLFFFFLTFYPLSLFLYAQTQSRQRTNWNKHTRTHYIYIITMHACIRILRNQRPQSKTVSVHRRNYRKECTMKHLALKWEGKEQTRSAKETEESVEPSALKRGNRIFPKDICAKFFNAFSSYTKRISIIE